MSSVHATKSPVLSSVFSFSCGHFNKYVYHVLFVYAKMPAPPPVAAFHPLPWLPPQGLLAAACLPAASHPLWANNGRRGPSLEAYSLGLYRGCCGWCFGEEGCACPWKAESMGVGSWGGERQEKAGRAQIKIQCLSAYVSTLALVHGVCAGSGDSWDFQGALLARQLTWWEREEARATN